MNEKFINANCAQMAAVTMWMYLTSLKLQCNLKYEGWQNDFVVVVYLKEGESIKIQKGFCYTTKKIKKFEADNLTEAFTCVWFSFEY